MSDQPKWTPGPWSVPGQPDKVCAEGYTRNGWAKVIATAHTPAWMNADEPWANANLIAAAPDLYAALEAAMAFIESHVADPDITDEMIRNYRALQDLRPRDILAKANPQLKET